MTNASARYFIKANGNCDVITAEHMSKMKDEAWCQVDQAHAQAVRLHWSCAELPI